MLKINRVRLNNCAPVVIKNQTCTTLQYDRPVVVATTVTC